MSIGMKEERLMMTGIHTVSDIFCVVCGSPVGWKYVSRIFSTSAKLQALIKSSINQETAHDKAQKYKEGKFILER